MHAEGCVMLTLATEMHSSSQDRLHQPVVKASMIA